MGVDASINAVTQRVIGAAIEVHKHLGAGYPERAYEAALEIEMRHRGLLFVRQHRFEVTYRNVVVVSGRLDFLVENQVVVELKSVHGLSDLHRAQVLTYLKATRCPIGLLLNFAVPAMRHGIERLTLTP